MSQSSPMAATSCGGRDGDSSIVQEEKKKLWSDVVRTKTNKQQTTATETTEMVIRKKMSQVVVVEDAMPNNIPRDIVVQIFSWLPTKSLVQFRWACKYLFNLITRDGSFFKTHLLHHSTALDQIFGIISLSVLSFGYNCAGDRYRIFQYYLDYNNTTRIAKKILASCNGLIFLCQSQSNAKSISIRKTKSKRKTKSIKSESDNLCIWNPFTKEYRFLPRPLIIDTCKEVWVGGVKTMKCTEFWVEVDDSCKYGFGYDHTIDDYKVIRNTYYHVTKGDPAYSKEDPVLRSDVQVYTLGTNSWRRIEPNPYTLSHDQKEGVFANGAIYWIDSVKKELISFDIEKEKFQSVSKIPKLNNHDNNWHYVRILMFEGSLCVVLNFKDPGRNRLEIWVMKDYVVNDDVKNELSWTRLSTITTKWQDPAFSIKPLRFTRDGQILIVTNEKDLVLYDRKTGHSKILCRICQDNNHHIQEVHTEPCISKFGNLFGSRTKKRRNKV